jgi:hypothetical protein
MAAVLMGSLASKALQKKKKLHQNGWVFFELAEQVDGLILKCLLFI